jgi:hypothetical protein
MLPLSCALWAKQRPNPPDADQRLAMLELEAMQIMGSTKLETRREAPDVKLPTMP